MPFFNTILYPLKVTPDSRRALYIERVPWNLMTGLPTTAAGYGITNVYTKSEVDALLASVSSSQLHIGSIYTNTTGTNPGLPTGSGGLGYGTWARFAEGQFLVGVKTGDPDFPLGEHTGGFRVTEVTGTIGSESSHTHGVTSAVSVANHAFTQPTISWPAGVPTNASGAVDSHTVTNTPVTSAAGSAHTHTWTGNFVPILPPYIAAFLWKRTA